MAGSGWGGLGARFVSVSPVISKWRRYLAFTTGHQPRACRGQRSFSRHQRLRGRHFRHRLSRRFRRHLRRHFRRNLSLSMLIFRIMHMLSLSNLKKSHVSLIHSIFLYTYISLLRITHLQVSRFFLLWGTIVNNLIGKYRHNLRKIEKHNEKLHLW